MDSMSHHHIMLLVINSLRTDRSISRIFIMGFPSVGNYVTGIYLELALINC